MTNAPKVAILAGGKGERMAGCTLPKPLCQIGGMPILEHIVRYFGVFGHSRFFIALGHKGEEVRRGLNQPKLSGGPYSLELVDTGQETATGGRVKRLASYVADDTFLLTWSDGLADVDIRELLRFHKSHGRLATVTAVHPPERFGVLELDGPSVVDFQEKPCDRRRWINGAFFVLEPGVMDYIAGDGTFWEEEPMRDLARDGQLMAYRHEGFWQCMDTPKDLRFLEDLWQSGRAPWKVWE